MAFGTPVAGTVAYSASGGTSVAPSYPAGVTATDTLILIVGQKPSTANGGTVATPAGWTLRGQRLAAGGYGTTLGADTGNTSLRIYTKDTVTGGESGSLTVTLADNNVAWAMIVRSTSAASSFAFAATDGEDPFGGNVSIACAADPGFTTGDLAVWAMCIPTDVTTPSQFSVHAISATGAPFVPASELVELDSGTGNDIGGFVAWSTVSSGTSSAAPTFSATAGGTTTNVRGPGVVLRVREAAAASYVYKGSAGWGARYKGLRSDAALYKGAKTLHP